MQIIKLFLVLLLFIPTLSHGQTSVSEKDLQEIIMLLQQGQSDKALDKITALRNTITVKDSLYIMLIGASAQINMKAYNCEEAIRDNEEIIQLMPEAEADCLQHIARFKKHLGDFEGAIISYKRILQLNPDLLVFDNMASVYNSAGRYRDAINILNSNPDTGQSTLEYYHYAIAYFKLNKLDSAKLNIDKYLTTDDSASDDWLAYKYAAQIYSALGYKNKSCELITKANDILATKKSEEQISQASKKMQEYYFVKNTLIEIEETKKLKTEICR